MSFQLSTTLDFTVMECGGCCVVYALPDAFIEANKKSGKGFYCPNGCSRVFSDKTREDRLREQLKRERIEREQAEGLLKAERNAHRTCDGGKAPVSIQGYLRHHWARGGTAINGDSDLLEY